MRLHLGRAAAQTLANSAGVELLHIKGDTVGARGSPRIGTRHRRRCLGAALAAATHCMPCCAVAAGASTARSATARRSATPRPTYMKHGAISTCTARSQASASRPRPPSIGCGRARRTLDFAGVPCPGAESCSPVGDRDLSTRRGPEASIGRDIWNDATADRRDDIEREVDALDARLAFDAAFGRLAEHRGAREYRLWKVGHRGRWPHRGVGGANPSRSDAPSSSWRHAKGAPGEPGAPPSIGSADHRRIRRGPGILRAPHAGGARAATPKGP